MVHHLLHFILLPDRYEISSAYVMFLFLTFIIVFLLHFSFTSTSTVGKRSMSPIQEETGSDDMEEREGQEPEYNQTDCFAESLPDGKKRAKKFKKIETERLPAGKHNVCAHDVLFCLRLA